MMVSPLNRAHNFSCNRLIIPNDNDHHAFQSKSTKPVLETEASPYTAQQLRPSSSKIALGGGF